MIVEAALVTGTVPLRRGGAEWMDKKITGDRSWTT
jgi:hypothetical protein